MAISPASGKKGNSGFVARKLTEALSSFLEVDESMVESRLLNPKKSRIALNNVRLKPRIIKEDHDCAIEISGCIDNVLFSWKWNYFKNSKTYTGIIKKSALILKGAKIVIKPISGTSNTAAREAKDRLSKSSHDAAFKEETDAKNKQPKFIRKVMEQCSINVEDVEVHIKLPTSPGDHLTRSQKAIVMSGKGIDLEPIRVKKKDKKEKKQKKDKKHKKDPLLQELRVDSISAKVININEHGTRTILPFIDPFRYTATVKRLHGQRFSGLSKGLEVIGNEMVESSSRRLAVIPVISSNDEVRGSPNASMISTTTADEIKIFADDTVIETALCPAMPVTSWDFDETRYSDGIEKDDSEKISAGGNLNLHLGDLQVIALFSAINMFIGEAAGHFDVADLDRHQLLTSVIRPGGCGVLSAMAPRTFARSTKELNKSSLFNFPLPYVKAILPNKIIVVAKQCYFRMRTDGTRCVLEGDGGVIINDEKLLQDGSSFTVDIIKKDIILKPNVTVARSLFAKEDAPNFKLNLSGIQLMGVGAGELARLRKLATPTPPIPITECSPKEQPCWSLKVQGTTEIKL